MWHIILTVNCKGEEKEIEVNKNFPLYIGGGKCQRRIRRGYSLKKKKIEFH